MIEFTRIQTKGSNCFKRQPFKYNKSTRAEKRHLKLGRFPIKVFPQVPQKMKIYFSQDKTEVSFAKRHFNILGVVFRNFRFCFLLSSFSPLRRFWR